jgi:Tfp pilus assembly protein PilF
MSRTPEKRVARAAPPEGDGLPPGPARAPLGGDGRVGLLLAALTLAAYASVLHAGFIWDDDGHVTRADLRPLHGLWRIWFEPGATQQYYPLLHSAFWLEHRLWGDAPAGYHLANVLLHAAAAFLLYRVLRQLALPGALFAAAAFAVHPVCVESVAWVSEQKNTLSAVFCLAAALAYLRFDEGRRGRTYGLATALFMMALATKTVTATLPAALLVVLWWKRGRLRWRADALPLSPWLLMGAAAGLVTAWVEQTYIGAKGAAFEFGLADRVLVAGRALWFYAGKILWPADLAFIYPRWAIDSGAPWQYLFPAAAAALLAVLFLGRGRARGPLAAALLFAGTLFPALGFFNVFPFVYSFVADHFAYLAAAVAMAAGAAALASAAAKLPFPGRRAAAAAAAFVVALLGWMTSRQCSAYADAKTLWLATLARNPGCWMACENLGGVYLGQGNTDLAIAQFNRALEIKPDDDGAMNELGVSLLQLGRLDEAVGQFQRALAIAPDRAETHLNLGVALLGKGRADEAAVHFRRALILEPGSAKAHKNLASVFAQKGQWDEAAAQLQRAAEIEPGDAETLGSLGTALLRSGRRDAAIAAFRGALGTGEANAPAHASLANALAEAGRDDEAVTHYRRALEMDPGLAQAHNNLANLLLKKGAAGEALAHLQRAVELDGQYVEARFNLANTLLGLGRTDDAVANFQRAIELRPDFAQARVNLAGALLQEGRLAEATVQFRAALALDPGDAQVLNDFGVALMEQGRTEEAVAQFGKALQARPGFASAHINLGNLFLRSGRAAEAADNYGRALEADPENAHVRNNLGIALLKLGRPAEAEAQFRRALEIEPGYAEARRNLSIVAGRTGAP